MVRRSEGAALALGIEVELVAVYFAIVSVAATVGLIGKADRQARRRPTLRLLAEWTGWSVTLVANAASGVALAIGSPAGSYLLTVVMLFRSSSNVWTAWVLISEVPE